MSKSNGNTVIVTDANFKKIVKKMKKQFDEKNIELNLTAINELFAKSLGYRNYDSLQSFFNKENILSVNHNDTLIELFKKTIMYLKNLTLLFKSDRERSSSIAIYDNFFETLSFKIDIYQEGIFSDSHTNEFLDSMFVFLAKYLKDNNLTFTDYVNESRHHINFENQYQFHDIDQLNHSSFPEQNIKHEVVYFEIYHSFFSHVFKYIQKNFANTLFNYDFIKKFIILNNKIANDTLYEITDYNPKNHIFYSLSLYKENESHSFSGSSQYGHKLITHLEKAFDYQVYTPLEMYLTDYQQQKEFNNFYHYLIAKEENSGNKLQYDLLLDIVKFMCNSTINTEIMNKLLK